MNEGPEIHVGDFVLRERNQRVPKSQIESLNVPKTSKRLAGCRNVVDDLCGESAVPQKTAFLSCFTNTLEKTIEKQTEKP